MMGAFNDVILSVADSNAVKALQAAWKAVKTDKDPSNDYLADQYHDQAEKIRANYGYSGGSDGSGFTSLAQVITPVANATGTGSSGSGAGLGNGSTTPVSDSFFNDVPTGVTQVTSAMSNIDLNKIIAVGAGFMFLMFFGNFITRRRR